MANEYYERLSEMNPGDLADGLAMEAEFDAISQAFGKLPNPHTGGNGFDGPVRVGDAVNTDEAVNKGQLDNALGTAKLLPIATYGDLNAAAWAALPSGSYLLFGAGSQFSNAPWALTAGKTYSVAVRHVIGDAGVSLYLDEVVLSSTDDTAHVDIGRPAYRLGQTLAGAYGVGWNGMALKKGGLPPLEALTPAADRLPYYNGANGAALTPLTAFGRSLLDDMGAAEALATLGALSAAGGTSTGDQLGITAPQFANDKKFATTEFVQRALGSFNGYISVNTSRSLAATDIGKALLVGASGITLTLPTPSSLGAPLGVAVELFTNSSTSATIKPGAGVILNHMGAPAVASISLLRGQSLKLIAVTDTVWQVIASTCGLGFNADFAGELTIGGQQKLPSGWIMKRGNISTSTYPYALTFPTAFPTECVALIVTGWTASLGHTGRNQGGATISLNAGQSGSPGFDWVAFGY